ncbi:hypothetical protein GCM10011504_00430 [Siccirubricoccus deserti]|uniref:Uncharacterized protein n=1 Tax=Siccirubricoccus deserti TaxID=2013562 RepID=A0A9X0QUJ0_9PROT|nr:hypothetical protein [Siccirubricoccus deserti]MBC4014056.1 hypothetical protein [Siccirubricoccus deserti]GGC26123.1 hypothetical protein GCM10011504_00430 [Siccirubricoccus deserti]
MHGPTPQERRRPLLDCIAELSAEMTAWRQHPREDTILRSRPPIMGAGDFSFMLPQHPGCFAKIGQKDAGKGEVPLHPPLRFQ